jgi:hypothetical protein
MCSAIRWNMSRRDSCVAVFLPLEANVRLRERGLAEQKDGTARSCLALDNLQLIEKMRGSQKEDAEAALRGVLGSMYTGAQQLFPDYMLFFLFNLPSAARSRLGLGA